uniref:BOD1/SHG1 domain-containing protein n=1 Tax=Parascaris univalens TaxID=6257 RepID=A0A915BNN3_PARUN
QMFIEWNSAAMSSLSKDDQKNIEQLVDKYKKDGRFDEVRRRHFASITTDDNFMRLSKEAERLVDDILANRPAYFSKNQVREKLLAELSSRFRKQCEAIVFQHIGTDESIVTLLGDIRPRVESFLGLFGEEALDDAQQIEENHQVCDMEIESESEQGLVESGQQLHTLSEIRLPPSVRSPQLDCLRTSPASSLGVLPMCIPNAPGRSGQSHQSENIHEESSFILESNIHSTTNPPHLRKVSSVSSLRRF